eukprot:4709761-Pleurochrysis_carterae.AAC.1
MSAALASAGAGAVPAWRWSPGPRRAVSRAWPPRPLAPRSPCPRLHPSPQGAVCSRRPRGRPARLPRACATPWPRRVARGPSRPM